MEGVVEHVSGYVEEFLSGSVLGGGGTFGGETFHEEGHAEVFKSAAESGPLESIGFGGLNVGVAV